jgi:predicted ferric reductase
LLALARLAGLLAATSVLVQIVLIGRVRWVEQAFGLDRLSRVHHWNGFAIVALALLHPLLMYGAYATLNGLPLLQQAILFAQHYRGVLLAELGLVVFLIVLVTALTLLRKRLTYEQWYAIHFVAYGAIALVLVHQFAVGGSLNSSPALRSYWIALWVFCVGNVLLFRFVRPVYNYLVFRTRVDRVIPETAEVNSIYIIGRSMSRFRIQPGQFMIVRFLQRGLWWEAHPFSLSCAPNGDYLRLSIKALGDFTRKAPTIKPGTPVLIDGPHGIMTPRLSRADRVLLIAGGIGITPLRALAEHFATLGRDVVLLYGNRTLDGIVFYGELDGLARERGLVVHHVLSREPNWPGEKGFVDRERIQRLAPDVVVRDVYLCGPPIMMGLVRQALRDLGVPNARIHWERFAL